MLKQLKPFVTVAAAALSLNAYAASDMFLKLDSIDGEAEDKFHGKEVEVLAWSWGMTQSGTFHHGGSGATGKANFQDISITKYIDLSSVPLMKLAATGDHISEATLVVRKVTTNPIEVEEITMYKVLVTSSSVGGSGGEDRLTENITLNFESFCITYTEDTGGGVAGKDNKLCWNIAANSTCSVAQVENLFEMQLVKSLPRRVMHSLNPVCDAT